MNRVKGILIVVIILLPLMAFGQAKVGTTGLNFLKVGVGARAVGMGEAFTAVASDVSALYYNPAGLIQLRQPEATFSMVDYPADIKFIYIGGAVPTPATNGVVGVHITSLFTNDMIETTPEMPNGTGRTFTASDLAVGVAYCQQLTDKFSVGVSFKYLNESLADASANGWSADVGTFYTTGWKRINIGMVIQNFGPDMTHEKAEFPLPINFKFGASFVAWETPLYNLLLAGEFVHPNDNLEVYHIGAEFTAMQMFSIRVGKRFNGLVRDSYVDGWVEDSEKDPFVEFPVLDEDGAICFDGASIGLGVVIPQAGVNIDYAWAGMGTLGAVHRFSVGYKLSGRLFR
ncbi:MAG: PorV/PorQ family protein [Candidatus Electryoneaceae bacterium]|nr:PorV/PorQ family protein [Candidatus Electryoneaceae bacterium]